jgi:hypothetical protein
LRLERLAKARARASAGDIASFSVQQVQCDTTIVMLNLYYLLLLTTEWQEGRKRELAESFAMRKVHI